MSAVRGFYRQARQLLVVALHAAEHLLAVPLQLLQLLLDDSGVQRLALLDQHLPLVEDVLDLPRVQGDLLLEGLGEREVRRSISSGKFQGVV